MNLLQQIRKEEADTKHFYMHEGETLGVFHTYGISAFIACNLFPYTECYKIELYDTVKMEYVEIPSCKLKVGIEKGSIIRKYQFKVNFIDEVYNNWVNSLTLKIKER